MTLPASFRWPLFAALASALILGGAYVFEYGFGYAPCALCYDQRHIHQAVIGLGLVTGLVFHFVPSTRRLAWAACFLIAAVFAWSAGFASWHAGIEYGWWDGPASCTSGANVSVSANDINALLNGTGAPIVLCDEAAWTLFGISMAGYNALMSAGLAAISIVIGWTRR